MSARLPTRLCRDAVSVESPAADASSLKLPETPVRPDFGNESGPVAISLAESRVESQVMIENGLTTELIGDLAAALSPPTGGLSCHQGETPGNCAQSESPPGLTAEIERLLAERSGNLSRPPPFAETEPGIR